MARISTASGSERVIWRAGYRRVATAISLLFLVVSSLPLTGCLEDRNLGAWTPLPTRQFAVPLAPGTTTVEVRDTRDGWVERVSVESDGRSVTDGIRLEPLQPAVERTISDADAAYLCGDSAVSLPASGTTVERASALAKWVGHRIGRLQLGQYDEDLDGAAAPLVKGTTTPPVTVDPHVLPSVVTPRPRVDDPPVDSDDGCEVLRSIADGARSNCRSSATVFHDAASLLGFTVRRVDMAVRYGSPFEGHSVVEVWSPELGKWIVVDAFFQAIWTLDGAPASAIELHRAAVEGRSRLIGFQSTGLGGASLSGARVNPQLYPRNVFVRTASGAWLTRTSRAPAPVVDTNILQCDDDAVFAAPAGAVDEYAVRRDSIHGRIAFQATDGKLVVAVSSELFEAGRFEARSTRQRPIEFFDDVLAHDPGDAELAAGAELLPETGFADDDGDGQPDSWKLARPPSVFAPNPDGSAVFESGADGALLSISPATLPLTSVVGFARLSVERGSATLSFGGKLQSAPFMVSAGRSTVASTGITGGGRGESGIQLELAPNSRVTVSGVSMRGVPKYDELSGVTAP